MKKDDYEITDETSDDFGALRGCNCVNCCRTRARYAWGPDVVPDEPAPADKVQVGGDHYKNFVIQPAEFITRNDIGFLEGCVIKRVCRYAEKNGREDLEKAIHELQLLMQYRYGS